MQIFRKDTTTDKVEVTKKDIETIQEPEKSSYRKLDIARFVIEEGDQDKQQFPKEEKVRPKSTGVTVTQHEAKKKSSRYFRELDVGRIVIEEIPEYKREKQLVSTNVNVRPKSTEVVLTGQWFDEFSSKKLKEDVGKVGKLDITNFEKHSSEYGNDEQKKERHKDLTHTHKTKAKLGKDDEKKTARYSKNLDVERIVIEEIPEDKEQIPKPKVSKLDTTTHFDRLTDESMTRTRTLRETVDGKEVLMSLHLSSTILSLF